MAYAVFNDGATDGREPWADYEFVDEPLVEVLEEKGPGRTERVELFACHRRRYRWPAGLTEAQREAWEAFLQARGILRDAFLVEDPRDPVRELVALEPAVGDGARVTFSVNDRGSTFPRPDRSGVEGLGRATRRRAREPASSPAA